MFWNYLKVAVRNIRKHKAYSLINISGLTVGMACFILISLWVYEESHYDSFHANSGRLFRLILHDANDPSDPGFPSTPYILPQILKSEFPEIEETVRVRDRAYPSAVRNGDKSFYEDRFFMADASFFTMFSYDFLKGNPATALAGTRNVVITRDMASKYFGADDPMGKTLRWNESEDLAVTGIIDNVPANSHLQFDFVASLDLCGREKFSTWWRETAGYVLLRDGATREEVEPKISGIILKHHPDDTYTVSLQPLQDAHLTFSHGGSNDRRIILIIAFIAAAVLAIACVNFTNITTARSSIRALEVGVRKVVGARRPEIVRQFLGEAVGLSFLSLVLAVFIVDLLIPLYNKSQGKEISLLGSGSLPALLFLVAVALVTGFSAGGYPAILLSSFKPVHVLKNKFQRGGRSAVLRTALVISQFAIAVIMIILTIFAQKQFKYIQNAELGFDREQIIRFQVNDVLREKYDLFKDKLLQNPKVLNVTAASALPHLLFNVNDLEWEGMSRENPVEVNFLYVDHDYAETFGLEIVRGRDFSKEFLTDASEAFVVNESALPLLEFDEPLGKKLILAGREGRIIGVVKDFNFKPLIFGISPLVMAIRPDWYFDMMVKISPEEIPATLASIEQVFKEVSPGFPFDYFFIDDIFNRVYGPLRFINGVLNAFAGIALFISCLGLFGLASLLTEQRKKEVGIRKVLGASASGILALLSRKFIVTVLAANIIAVPIAYFATRQFLNLFVYRTEVDLLVFLIAAVATVAIALATVSFQVLRTARINPADCLRYE
ncbi:MAG: ABC transporter permease [Candidatus Aminicenantes bacterium]|nr:ABC transporter permease [Candidatus Aminicenantes bacterium]